MTKKLPLWAALLLMLLCVAVTFQVTYLAVHNQYASKLSEIGFPSSETTQAEPESDGQTPSASSDITSKLLAVDELFRNYYIGDIDDNTLVDGIIRGYMSGTGDNWCEYMNAEEFSEYQKEQSGDMSGIGIQVVWLNDLRVFEVVLVIPNSPALEAGLQPGDLITTVAGENISDLGYTMSLSKLRGETGTTAEFTVVRGTETLDFSIVRSTVTSQTVIPHVYDDGSGEVGVIRVLSFDSTTPGQFAAAVSTLLGNGVRYFVFDVRSNPGGSLDSIVSILDTLLPEGPIIRFVDKNGKETTINSEQTCLNLKAAVLVNGNTASAAELFTAALHDYDRAIVVGTQTYGKGVMQTIRPLGDGSAIRVTYAEYNPPFSDNYDGVGITPDIEAELDEKYQNTNIYLIPEAEDAQLIAAVNALREKQG